MTMGSQSTVIVIKIMMTKVKMRILNTDKIDMEISLLNLKGTIPIPSQA
jgi:hypothetical protein